MPTQSKESILRGVPSALNPPPMVVQPGVDKLESPVTLPEDVDFPKPHFTGYRLDARKQRLPQCISHRGNKAHCPENTMLSFRSAVDAGTHALETDVHITKDEVVVLSHDADMKRCFGRPEKILDSTWDEIKEMRTLKEPHVPMPRLVDLLEYLAQPGLEEIWLLLDIKLDNDADLIMRLLGSTIASVTPAARKKWEERVVLGIWAAKYLPLAIQYLPGFPVTHIGFSLQYARHFFTVPNVSFNMLLPTLIAPGGRSFIRAAREEHHRQVYAWTVNEEDRMEWCIRRKLDGVITDDPTKFLAFCDRFDEYGNKRWTTLTVRSYFDAFRIWIWVFVALVVLKKVDLGPVASQKLIRRERK